MLQAVKKAREVDEPPKIEHLLTFQEYLEYVVEPDVRYELVRGKLIPMPTPTHLHTNICKFLVYKLQRYFAVENLDLVANALGTGVRTEDNTSRIPDVVVFSKTVWEQVLHRPGAGVLDFKEQPILVIEVVSSNRRDDYVVKRDEYEIAKIPSYWIVDPKKKLVRVFTNSQKEEGYDFVDFSEEETIVSSQFSQLVLSVKELLNPPIVEELIKEERQQAEDERLRAETLEQRAETFQQQVEEERQQAETERQRAETERQRAETLEQRAETFQQQVEEERQRAETLEQRAETFQQQVEEERQRAETLEQRAETFQQQVEEERQQAENERLRAETFQQQAEEERQRAETERLRAEKLAQRLLQMGINPED